MDNNDWLGHFKIYVGNYYVDDIRAHEHNCASQPGEDLQWTWGNGWALGDNSRDRYCKRRSPNVRKFDDYLAALECAQQLMRKPTRRNHDLFVVYAGPELQRVNTLEEARALDAKHRSEQAKRDQARERYTSERFPALTVIQQRYGGGHGLSLSFFLKDLRDAGGDISKVIAGGSVSRSTAYTYRKQLRDLGIDY